MSRAIILAVVAFVMGLAVIEPAFAGPGGKIASAAFETFWGKVALGALTVLLLPMIIYISVREWLSERRARKDLRFMARHSPLFDWLRIMERAKDCFTRVHSGWEKEDLSGVSNWMTGWYWQNQQMVYLDKWKSQGLVNVCDVRRVNNVKPLLFVHRNNYEREHEGSTLVISISAKMSDYLEDRSTGKVVEGSKNFKDVERIWSFTLENGAWKVSDIEEGSMSFAYAKLAGDLPQIETTLLGRSRA